MKYNFVTDLLSRTRDAAVSASSAGDNTLVALVAGKAIRVTSYVLVAAGDVAASIESSGGRILGGPMSLGTTGGVAAPFNPGGYFQTDVGEALVINLGGAVQVGGHLSYILVD